MHSAFYQTPLEALLKFLAINSLILAGLTSISCITCTAHDAYMRDFRLFIPSDCSAARSREEHRQALIHLKTMGKAHIAKSTSLIGRVI